MTVKMTEDIYFSESERRRITHFNEQIDVFTNRSSSCTNPVPYQKYTDFCILTFKKLHLNPKTEVHRKIVTICNLIFNGMKTV